MSWCGGADYTGAGQMQQAGAAGANQLIANMLTQSLGYLAPWRTAGGTQSPTGQVGGAVGQLMSNLGLPGGTGTDPTAALSQTPGYQFGLNQGIEARQRAAAATGQRLSGAQQRGLQQFGTNYALQQAWQPYMSALQNLSGQGLGAATTSGNWAMAAGAESANNIMSGANAMAQAQIRQQQADQMGLMSALGLGAGILAAPFTGGTSLLGAGISGLQGAFGGGGASPGYGGGGADLGSNYAGMYSGAFNPNTYSAFSPITIGSLY